MNICGVKKLTCKGGIARGVYDATTPAADADAVAMVRIMPPSSDMLVHSKSTLRGVVPSQLSYMRLELGIWLLILVLSSIDFLIASRALFMP